MGQGPSWEANWFAASQEIPRILWNLMVHYRIHKHQLTVPILRQPDPVHNHPHPTSWRHIFLLSFHLRLGFPSGTLESLFIIIIIIIIIIIHGFICYITISRPESSLSLYLQTIQQLGLYKISKPQFKEITYSSNEDGEVGIRISITTETSTETLVYHPNSHCHRTYRGNYGVNILIIYVGGGGFL